MKVFHVPPSELVELDDVYQKRYVLLAGDVVVSCWLIIMYLYTTWKVGGATLMYWLIMAAY